MSRDLLTKAAAEIEAAGIAKGYRMAVKDMRREINVLLDHMLRGGTLPDQPEAKIDLPQPQQIMNWETVVRDPKMRPAERRSGQSYVLNMIHAVPGLKGSEIVSQLSAAGTPVEERTARTALWRLKNMGAIEQRESRWWATAKGREMLGL